MELTRHRKGQTSSSVGQPNDPGVGGCGCPQRARRHSASPRSARAPAPYGRRPRSTWNVARAAQGCSRSKAADACDGRRGTAVRVPRGTSEAAGSDERPRHRRVRPPGIRHTCHCVWAAPYVVTRLSPCGAVPRGTSVPHAPERKSAARAPSLLGARSTPYDALCWRSTWNVRPHTDERPPAVQAPTLWPRAAGLRALKVGSTWNGSDGLTERSPVGRACRRRA